MVYSGIELGWLNKGNGIPIPEIIQNDELVDMCAIYCEPEVIIELENGDIKENKNGSIIISTNESIMTESEYVNTLVHEYRHHWQIYNWGYLVDPYFNAYLEWEDMAIQYFSSSITELDALRFEVKFGKFSEEFEWVLNMVEERFGLERTSRKNREVVCL